MDVENLIQTDRLARLEEVNDLVAQGNKIAAIKRYRVLFETSLTEAKEAIEQLADGKAITVPQVSVLPEGETNQARSDLVEAEIRRLVQADKKIEASKLNRETFHTGLK
jgi:ribosomal protein L7/L12